jgi:exodeoxyribonuclease V gamma subunit
MMEILAARLADVIAQPLSATLCPEVVLINSRGMERWLSMQLAEHHGICANISYQFPRPYLMELLETLTASPGGAAFFHPDNLVWQVMKMLPELCRHESFAAISYYLDADDTLASLKRFQLSRRLARTCDQYLAYRPEMLLNWEKNRVGDDEEFWQAELWRRLCQDVAKPHPAILSQRLGEIIHGGNLPTTNLPARLSLIGISALPPLLIKLVQQLAAVTDIHLFLFNPCREYWSEILSEREMEQRLMRLRPDERTPTAEELFLERGNPLLASMGKISRDFLSAFAEDGCQHQDFFVHPGEATLLRTIQSDILNLVDRGHRDAPPLHYQPGDRSFECHSCHSPMREVEVLYSRLLSLFEEDPDLKPRDILVMTPDIETYAPFLESVFGQGEEEIVQHGNVHLPFSIADRKHLRHNPVTDALFALIDVVESRFEASRVLALLDKQMIRQSFGIAADEMASIHRWVDETGIRWGIDEAHLRELALPQLDGCTWRHGMERMLLGYALPVKNSRLFHQRLPYDAIEGEQTDLLGRFLDFLECLFATHNRMRGQHTLTKWQATLTDTCQSFLHIDDQDDLFFFYRHLLETLQGLAVGETHTGFAETLPLSVVHQYLADKLEEAGFASGFLTGGITCCAMVPMRSIPFRVICLLGMNHANFPREGAKLGFDLIERHPRRGDRSKRDDDRYLFLETILCARERLIVLYTGQNIRDNSPIPPSVVVAELLDYIDTAFIAPSEQEPGNGNSGLGLRNYLVTTHPLQPFSPSYFRGDNRLFSYSPEQCLAAQSLIAPPQELRPFLAVPLPPDTDLFHAVGVTDLIHFFRHPARFFAEKRLGIARGGDDKPASDTENFVLQGLDRYLVAQTMLEARTGVTPPEEEYRALTQSGKLPFGTAGESQYLTLTAEVNRYAIHIQSRLPEIQKREIAIDLALGDCRLTGRIVLPSPQGLFLYRYAELTGKDYTQTWIWHLLLILSVPDPLHPTCLAGRTDTVEFDAPSDAAGILQALINLYREGLTRPLPFFPQSAWKYVQSLNTGKTREEALRAAKTSWSATDFSRGEGDDAYYRLCFANTDPLDDVFCYLAETVFQPLWCHRRVLSDTELL